MGIIINNGVRQPTVRIDHLHFAKDTPYDTSLNRTLSPGEQVMLPEVATALRGVLSEVVVDGTARRLAGGYVNPDKTPLTMGGKTGTGDNRIISVSAGGQRTHSRALSRTATFVFFLGERHFGTLTAFVVGEEASRYSFTSGLPVQVLRSMAPILQPYLAPGQRSFCHDGSDEQSVVSASAAP
jgi:membrane peptidoglycan carboxypeptidase